MENKKNIYYWNIRKNELEDVKDLSICGQKYTKRTAKKIILRRKLIQVEKTRKKQITSIVYYSIVNLEEEG